MPTRPKSRKTTSKSRKAMFTRKVQNQFGKYVGQNAREAALKARATKKALDYGDWKSKFLCALHVGDELLSRKKEAFSAKEKVARAEHHGAQLVNDVQMARKSRHDTLRIIQEMQRVLEQNDVDLAQSEKFLSDHQLQLASDRSSASEAERRATELTNEFSKKVNDKGLPKVFQDELKQHVGADMEVGLAAFLA